ncbi:hypothetical protein SAMN06269185_0345 [Natronoarchaeum philippinense]|uniref:Uncharacterized protein n=1 Tax=Natronoarchaeum philippinense TaxID=558529 RepID=A0A285N423_NATPI|nr:hypothetical protein [Natronoarchaeum philippinense]SNZ03693.1 hypothetical protein SAMN06269185_0345 [Natronoarchaeum philippinense]
MRSFIHVKFGGLRAHILAALERLQAEQAEVVHFGVKEGMKTLPR